MEIPAYLKSRITTLEATMKNMSRLKLFGCLVAAVVLGASTKTSQAQTTGQPAPDQPAVTIRGQTYTPRSILARNMGTPEDQTTQFPPHKIGCNIYYVGTRTLRSLLLVSPPR